MSLNISDDFQYTLEAEEIDFNATEGMNLSGKVRSSRQWAKVSFFHIRLMNQPSSILGLKPCFSKDQLGSFLLMIKSLFLKG